MDTNILEVGDLVAITERHKGGSSNYPSQFPGIDMEESYLAVIHSVSEARDRKTGEPYVYFTYRPHGIFSGRCGFGAAGSNYKPYGVIDITVIGHVDVEKQQPASWYPRPGNTGFDLMC